MLRIWNFCSEPCGFSMTKKDHQKNSGNSWSLPYFCHWFWVSSDVGSCYYGCDDGDGALSTFLNDVNDLLVSRHLLLQLLLKIRLKVLWQSLTLLSCGLSQKWSSCAVRQVKRDVKESLSFHLVMLCESQSWSSHALCILHCLASGLLNFGRGDWYRVEVARHENQLQNTMANFLPKQLS